MIPIRRTIPNITNKSLIFCPETDKETPKTKQINIKKKYLKRFLWRKWQERKLMRLLVVVNMRLTRTNLRVDGENEIIEWIFGWIILWISALSGGNNNPSEREEQEP